MNEFKFACPWCRQHMMCDMSQRGTVMQCPTCFQKVAAPMAPSPDAKYILTGSKVQEKKPTQRVEVSNGPAAGGKFSAAILIGFIVLALAAGAGVYYWHYQNKTAKPEKMTPPKKVAVKPIEPEQPKVVAPKVVEPKVVAPPANDTNWTLTLAEVAIPDTPAAGRIHGHDFKVERTTFQNGLLILRQSARGPMEFGVMINFGRVQAEVLAGKTINVSTDVEKAASVQLDWKNDSGVQRVKFDTGYAMRLEFGPLANNRLPGNIYVCTPDPEKSYLMGTFDAEIFKPKPKPTAPGSKKKK